MRSVEAGESVASHDVPAKDRWMGEGGPTAADPKVMVEGSGSGVTPHETMEGSGSGVAPHDEVREMSPTALEQGAGSKRSCPDESGQGSGDPSPKRFHRPRASA